MEYTNSTLIEESSIVRLKEAFLRTETVRADIQTNDKTPSWDGELMVYKFPGQFNKDDILGRIPIQVKGKCVKRLSGRQATFPVDISDLNNYFNDSGVMFFLVEMVNLDKYRIYYAALHRFDLRRLIAQAGKQKTKSIKLEQFPLKHKNGILQILHAFLLNKGKQGALLPNITSFKDVEQSDTAWEKFEFSIPKIGLSCKEDMFEQFLSGPQYIYGKPKNLEVFFPIDKIYPERIIIAKDIQIKVGDEILFDHIDTIRGKGGKREVRIGKEITLTFSEDRLHYNYTPCGSLDEQIASLTFLVALATGRTVSIGNQEFPAFDNSKWNKHLIQEIKERLEALHRAKTTLNQLHVKKDLNLKDLSPSENQALNYLITGIMDKQPVPLSVNGHSGVGVLHIGNIALLLSHKKSLADDGYYISDFFESDDLFLTQGDDESGPKIPVSPYCIMSASDYNKIDNAELSLILSSVTKYPFNTVYGEQINWVVLELLKFYDIGGTDEVLDVAIELLNYLQQNNVKEQTLYQINQLQAEKRRRALTSDENRQLIGIREKNNSLQFKLAANILLESFQEARMLFEQLSPDEQNKFSQYPIMHLWHKSYVDDMLSV